MLERVEEVVGVGIGLVDGVSGFWFGLGVFALGVWTSPWLDEDVVLSG